MNEQTASRERVTIGPVGFGPITGRRILLERADMRHVSFLERCFNDAAFMQLYRLSKSRGLNRKKIEEWISSEQEYMPQQLKRIEWVVSLMGDEGKSPEPIGLTALANYVPTHNRAEILVGILEQKHRGTFLALETSYLVMDFAFNSIKLNKIVSLVYGHNQHAQESTMHLGLTQEGYLRKHIWDPYNKEFVDAFQNGLLVDDFRSNSKTSRLSKRLLGRDITLPPPALKSKKMSVIEREVVKQKLVDSLKKQSSI